MNTFDITYVTRPISEDIEEKLLDLDINVGSHSGLHFVMASIVSDDFQEGAMNLARELQRLGVHVERMDLDLVNQSGIATRCGKSRQAVSAWTQCNDAVNPFPTPHTVASGPLWAWSDVNEWLRRTGKEGFDDACSASAALVDAFNVEWRQARWPKVDVVEYEEVASVSNRSPQLTGWTVARGR